MKSLFVCDPKWSIALRFTRPCSKTTKSEKTKKNVWDSFHETRSQTQFSYPHQFKCSMKVSEYLSKYVSLKPNEVLKDEVVSLSGRVFSIRSAGKSLVFLDLHQNESKVQIKADVQYYTGDFFKEIEQVR